jgi:hypothetical protein
MRILDNHLLRLFSHSGSWFWRCTVDESMTAILFVTITKLLLDVLVLGLNAIEFVFVLLKEISQGCLEMECKSGRRTESIRDWNAVHCEATDAWPVFVVDIEVEDSISTSSVDVFI